MKRLCGIDYGRRRVGLAFTDPSGVIVSRALTVDVSGPLSSRAEAIAATLASEPLSRIVLGLPQMLDGSPGTLADEVKEFAALLAERLSVPITFWDERLTSVQADRLLRDEVGMRRKKRTRPVNAVSASLILQSYLDAAVEVADYV